MIEIFADDMKAALAPELGGAVISLTRGERNILRPATSHEAAVADPREAACYPCVPWFSRLIGGLDFHGAHYDLAPTLPACDPDHALHGHGWVKPWTVTEQGKARLCCRFDHAPQPGVFPFPFVATQEFVVSKDKFAITLTVTNSGDTSMPAGLGLHPFFPARIRSEICFAGYPDQPKNAGAPGMVGRRRLISDSATDDTINHWDGTAEIVYDDMRIYMKSNARILHLYSPEGADFLCAEPVTHRPGDFGRDILSPGESMKLVLTLTIESQPSAHN